MWGFSIIYSSVWSSPGTHQGTSSDQEDDMNDELFGDRRKANEESYFTKRDEQLRQRMRARR